ncbi:methyltransferase domain-containing protein [Streptosporangium carneum]|uniref:Methyltransferase domain-containing protein n=1 Tax=Streptosporangium carneum TaxID=47481 RepID=A0A9W6MI31_9ACTN|nr:methyltransferase domain-containing protein [Streptosporangium carneum]GLK14817.1 hypothetical protein GCM10017600_82290 [Streptosporangium carneum]
MHSQIAHAFHQRADSYSRSEWHAELAADFVAWAGLEDGDRVLDVGAGTGFSTFAAARSVGVEGKVVGLDLSEAMLRKGIEFGPDTDLFDLVVDNSGFITEPSIQASDRGAAGFEPVFHSAVTRLEKIRAHAS